MEIGKPFPSAVLPTAPRSTAAGCTAQPRSSGTTSRLCTAQRYQPALGGGETLAHPYSPTACAQGSSASAPRESHGLSGLGDKAAQFCTDVLAALSLGCLQVLVQKQLCPPTPAEGMGKECRLTEPRHRVLCTATERGTTRSESTPCVPPAPTCSSAWQPQPSPGRGPWRCAAQVSLQSLQRPSPGARG